MPAHGLPDTARTRTTLRVGGAVLLLIGIGVGALNIDTIGARSRSVAGETFCDGCGT